jgi:Flp pilus assembly pilin Flp
MFEMMKRLWQQEEGQDLSEYALLLVLIVVVAIIAMKVFGSAVSSTFSNAGHNLTTATS